MPRYGPFIHQVYIADGFADDCDELIHRCTRVERVDYHHFCNIWKEMNMGCVYEGRYLGAEIAELSEEMIHIAKHYMLKDTSNFEEIAIGVFIVYALLHLQPYQGFAHLRLVPEDLPALNRIERVARRDKRYDVLYALGSVLIKGPVQYHAAEREYGMDLPVRKYLEGFTSIDKLGVRPKGVFRRQNEELDILKELHTITQRYTQAKMMISEKAQFDRNLQYINPNFPKEMETALMKLITGIHEDKYGSLGEGSSRSQSDDSNKISRSRRAIKDKAMKQDVKPVRHLVQLKNRKTSTVTSGSLMKNNEAGPSKATIESTKYKIKKDKNAVKSERKRRIPLSPRTVKRNCIKPKLKKNYESTSESDESDSDVIELSEEDDDGRVSIVSSSDMNKTTVDAKKKGKGKKTITATEREDIQVSKDKKKGIKDEDNELTQNEETNDNTADEQELDIEIDTLPVLIRTEDQGRLFEIEIIDHQTPVENLVNKTPVRPYKKKKDCPVKKINSIPGVSLEKIAETPVQSEPVPSTSSQLATITEIPEESKNKEDSAKPTQDKQVLGIANKVEKRDCKRVHLQSKLKRLGMLPIANFNVSESERTNEDDSDDEPLKKGLTRIED